MQKNTKENNEKKQVIQNEKICEKYKNTKKMSTTVFRKFSYGYCGMQEVSVVHIAS